MRHKAIPRIEVSIAAHYVPRRVSFLVDALEAIVGWKDCAVSIRIVTNDMALADEPLLKTVVSKLDDRGFGASFDQAHSMAHPWHLTWWHKDHLREWFCEGGAPDDLFIYIEDDIAITSDAISYFRTFLPKAKSQGVIPGFVRYEIGPQGDRIAIDFRGSQIVRPEEVSRIDDQLFVAPQFPYWAGFVMDRDLCGEYLASPWSDIASADTLPQSRKHTCRVQSAWALTYEKIPEGLPSRYVVPVDEDLRPLECCQVWHTANNYSRSKDFSFGTISMRSAFRLPSLMANLAQRQWKVEAFARRAREKLKREWASRGLRRTSVS